MSGQRGNQSSEKLTRQPVVATLNATDTSRKLDDKSKSSVLSPMALMALGLAGAGTTAISREFAPDEAAQKPDTNIAVSEIEAPMDAQVDAPAQAVSGAIEQQMNALVAQMLAEKGFATGVGDVAAAAGPVGVVADTDASALVAEPVQVALAEVGAGFGEVASEAAVPVVLAQASTSAVTETTATGAATGSSAVATEGVSAGAALSVLAGVVLIGASSSSSSSGGGTPPPPADTTPPVVLTLAAHSATKTIELTYDSPLDASHLPAVGAFVVTTGGATNAVAGVAVNGSVVTLTMTDAFAAGANVTLAYADPTSGNDVNAIQDIAGNDAVAVSFTTGTVSDGYIRGAQIYIDTNKNGVADAAEKLSGIVTDESGNFYLPSSAPTGAIIALGGVNIDTGVPNNLVLRAPAGSTTVNALTTLVQGLIDAAPAGTTVTAAAAQANVVTALGLTLPAGKSLLTYDPLTATDSGALVAQKATAQVATLLSLAEQAPVAGTTGTQAVGTLISNLVAQINAVASSSTPTPIDLALPATVDSVLQGAGSTPVVSSQAVTDAKAAVSNISAATDLAGISTAQSLVLDHTAPAAPALDLAASSDAGASSTDNITNDTTPILRVTFDVAKTDGTAVVVGDVVSVRNGASQIGTATVTATDLAQGFVDVTLSQQAEGAYSLTTVVTDKASNASVASASLTVTIDTTVATLTATLATDSAVTSDNITNIGTVNVAGLEAGATWEYSTNAGTNWTAGTGTSVTLTGDGAKSVTVRQTDVAGNTSAASGAVAFTLDSTAVAPTLALATDSAVTTDNITNAGAVSVTGLETGASWEYSTNAGTNWTAGTGTSFTLTGDGDKSVTVRQTDVAGNVSSASAALAFTLDSAAVVPTVALATDSGAGTDGITNVGTFNVAGVEVGAAWQYSLDAGTNWVNGTGTSLTLTGDGAKSVTVRQTDVAGNVSAASGALDFALDTSAPTVTPISPADGGLTLGLAANLVLGANETLVKGSGTVSVFNAANTLIEAIDVNGSQVIVTGTGGNTQISINPSADLVKDTQYYVKVSAGAFTDAAGNAWAGIADATSWNFTGAGASVVVGSVAGDDVVNLAESGSTITVTGTLGAEASVLAAYTVADMTAVLTPASGTGTGVTLTNLSYTYTTGTWSADVLADALSGTADYALTVTFTGTTGAAANIVGVGTKIVHVDTVVAIPALNLATDSGTAADSLTNEGTVNVTGIESGATWQYSVNDGTLTTGTGSTIALTGDGAKSVVVQQTDAAGNVSMNSTVLAFTLDTSAPAKGVITAIDVNSGNTTDRLTNDATPVLTVTAETGMQLVLGQNGVALDPAVYTVTESSGTYTVTVNQSLADGGYGVVVLDAAGNYQSPSTDGTDPATFMVDATAPNAPVISVIDLNSGSTVDSITNDTTPLLKVTAEAGTTLYLGQGSAAIDPSLYSVTETTPGAYTVTVGTAGLPEGGYGLVAVDAAGNESALPTAGSTSAFLIDATPPAMPAITAMDANGGSTTDRLTNDTTPVLTVTGESGLTLKVGQGGTEITTPYTVTESTATPGTYTVTFSQPLGNGGYGIRAVDSAGNASAQPTSGTEVANFQIDAIAPITTVTPPDVVDQTTGVGVFNFVFNEAVTGFDATDVVVANGTKGTFTAVDTSRYSLEITPTSSTTPVNFSVDVAAGAAIDAAGNASEATTQFLASILFGTANADTLTVGPLQDQIFSGAGADVIKITSAANSTVAMADNVMDFSSGDKIDLSSLLGTGGSAYSSSALGDTGAGFIELKNLTLTQITGNNTTMVKFDVHFDASSVGGSGISGAVVDLAYNYAVVSAAQAVSPTFVDPTFGNSTNVWSNVVGNLSGSSANGKIALTADLTSGNPIIDANGKTLSVTLVVNSLVSTFDVGLESVAAGGATAVTTADNATHNVDVGITKTAGATVGANGTLEIITDTTILGTVGDNQLHMVSTYDAQQNSTHLQVQYDTNSTFGTTAASSIIAFDFNGDVTANLTPASLMFI